MLFLITDSQEDKILGEPYSLYSLLYIVTIPHHLY